MLFRSLPFCLMMLVPSHPLDVVPRSRLMAQVTLIDLGVRLTGDLGRDHLEMHHVVARRGLVALGAVLGGRRGVPELRDRPLRRCVALGTVLAEKLEVPILVGMASGAIQDGLFRGKARMAFRSVARWPVSADPVEEVFPHHSVFTDGWVVGFQLAEADPGQRQVVHVGRALVNSLMLAVAFAAAAYVGVERGRLAL